MVKGGHPQTQKVSLAVLRLKQAGFQAKGWQWALPQGTGEVSTLPAPGPLDILLSLSGPRSLPSKAAGRVAKLVCLQSTGLLEARASIPDDPDVPVQV